MDKLNIKAFSIISIIIIITTSGKCKDKVVPMLNKLSTTP
jgi:hypothetical protein